MPGRNHHHYHQQQHGNGDRAHGHSGGIRAGWRGGAGGARGPPNVEVPTKCPSGGYMHKV